MTSTRNKSRVIPSLRVEYVQIDYLEPNPFQYREVDQNDLEDLVISMRQYGFLGSLEVRPRNPDPDDPTKAADGKYQLIDGSRRLVAARLAGLTKIPVRRVWRSDEEMRILCFLTNSTVRPPSYWEEAQYFAELQKHGWSMQQIADRIGKTKSYVQARLDVLRNTNEQVLAAARANRIELSTAAILPYLPAESHDELITKLETGQLTSSDLRAMRKHMNVAKHHQVTVEAGDRGENVWIVPAAAQESLVAEPRRTTPEPEPLPAQAATVVQHLTTVPTQELPPPRIWMDRTVITPKTPRRWAEELLIQVRAVVPLMEERIERADLTTLTVDERRELSDLSQRLRGLAIRMQ